MVINPNIKSLKNLKILPSVVLVMKYHILSFVGHHSILNSFLMIQSVIKRKNVGVLGAFATLMTTHSYPGEWYSCCLGKKNSLTWYH